jgi:RNA polymerase-binding transcription factor DksA
MAPKYACHNGQKPETLECIGTDQRRRLEEALQTAKETAGQLDKRLRVKGDYGHGRGDPTVVDWELNLALHRRMEKEIEQLDTALRRMDGGNYWKCRVCGGAINPERQEALPYTTLCVAGARSDQAEVVP